MALNYGLGTPLGVSNPQFLMKTFSSHSNNETSGASFQKLAFEKIGELAGLENSAQTAIQQSLAGDEMTLIEPTVAMEEAMLAMKLMVQVQRKVVDAWKELKNMQM